MARSPIRIPMLASGLLALAASAVGAADWRIRGDASEVWVTSRHKALGAVRVVVPGATGTLSLDAKDAVTRLSASVPTPRARLVSPGDPKLASAIGVLSRQVPQVRFTSRSVRALGGGRFAAEGDMALGTLTRPVTLTLTLGAAAGGKGRRSLRGTGSLRVSELLRSGAGLMERGLAFMFHDDIQLNINATVER